MDFNFNMPFWAIFYCGFLIANGAMTIIISQNKSINYIFGETLSTLFAVSFFFMYFNAIRTPINTILLLMLFFILYQEIWINKELYKEFITENIPPQERNIILIVLGIIMLVFLSPFIYVVVGLLQ